MSSSDMQQVRAAADSRWPASPLLQTKLYLPPARHDLVPRSRLVEQITAGVEGALTLITAPAGFGKTSLFGAWRSSPAGQRYRLAWLSLDPDDDEPARFLQYLTGALDTALPGAFEQVAVQFRLAQSPSVKTVLAAILNCLAPIAPAGAAAPLDSLVLAMDDYHVLENPEIHQAVEYLLEHLPPCLHLVILTRADPPLRLARLKARGQLTEIRASALRFTTDETAQFLNQVMHLELPPADVAVLDARTEGWVAGLKLAALRLAEPGLGRSEASRFIRTFETNHQFAAGFLVEEVVSRQPPAVQEFLLRSSILERMCAPLCDRLMRAFDGHGANGRLPSEEVIEHLVRRNLFVVPLDEEGRWYRYHHLFRDLLRARLTRLEPGKATELHRAAAEWFEGQGLLIEAVKHAILTEDWDYAAGMVEHYGVATVVHSELATVRDWCNSFPEEVMQRRPALCVVHAWSLILSYREEDVPAIEARLAQAERGLKDPTLPERSLLAPQKPPLPLRAWVLGNVIQLRAARTLWPSNTDLDPQQLLQSARQSMELLAEAGDGATDSVNALNIAYAQMAAGDAGAVETALAEALAWTTAGRNHYGTVTSFHYRAHLAFCQGKLDRAERICADGRAVLSRELGDLEQNLPAIRSLDIVIGCVRLERGDLTGAEEALSRALDLFGWGPWMELTGYIAWARLRTLQGDQHELPDTLSRLECFGPRVLLCIQGIRLLGQLQIAPADPTVLTAAAMWARPIQPDLSRGVPMGIGPAQSVVAYYTYLAWAEVMVALGEVRDALHFIEPALALAQAQSLLTRVIELSLVQALAHNMLGESRRSWEALERALAAAESGGHLSTFDRGDRLRRLLEEAAARGLRRVQIRSILDGIGCPIAPAELGETPTPQRAGAGVACTEPQRPPAELIERLSEREQEILQLIADGLSNAEIAARLYIGIGTVKTHVNHLFGKLQASSRTQLVAKARMLNLLMPRAPGI